MYMDPTLQNSKSKIYKYFVIENLFPFFGNDFIAIFIPLLPFGLFNYYQMNKTISSVENNSKIRKVLTINYLA